MWINKSLEWNRCRHGNVVSNRDDPWNVCKWTIWLLKTWVWNCDICFLQPLESYCRNPRRGVDPLEFDTMQILSLWRSIVWSINGSWKSEKPSIDGDVPWIRRLSKLDWCSSVKFMGCVDVLVKCEFFNFSWSGLAIWLEFGIARQKYLTKPSKLRSSVILCCFFYNFPKTASIFFGSKVYPSAEIIRPR